MCVAVVVLYIYCTTVVSFGGTTPDIILLPGGTVAIVVAVWYICLMHSKREVQMQWQPRSVAVAASSYPSENCMVKLKYSPA
jgi:hypothetical protein